MGELSPGSVFAGHRIEAVAGRGGMGIVYRARQLSLDRTVALKVIAPALMQDPAIRRRFVRESKVAASIDHPNVIPIYYTGEENGIAYIAMRHVPGDDLRTLLRREGRLDAQRAARIVAQVAAALDAAHSAGLVHRDVKPANVLLGSGDHAYLTDFGLTKHVLSEAGATRPGQWVGTLDFVAPEQIRGERIDARADVYGLGCLLHYALTGRPPFAHDSDEAKLWAHLSEPPPRVTATAADVPAAFDAVVARALAKAPPERYQSAGDLARAALAAAAGDDAAVEGERMVAVGAAAPVDAETRTAATQFRPPDVTAAQPPVTPAPRRRRPLVAAAVVVLLLGAGAAAAALLIGDDGQREPAATAPTSASEPQLTTLRLGGRLNAVTTASGRVWVGRFRGSHLMAVDPQSAERVAGLRPEIGVGVSGLEADGDDLWAVLARDRRLVHVNARTGKPIGDPVELPAAADALAVDRDSIWVGLNPQTGGANDELLRIDRRSGRTLATYSVADSVRRLAVANGAVWILSTNPARLTRLDPETNARRHIRFESERTGDLEWAAGSLWVTLPDADQLARVNPRTGNVATVAVGADPAGIALHRGTIWVANRAASTLTQVDSRSGRVRGRPLQVPLNPYELATTSGAVWVSSLATGTLTRVSVAR